MAQKSAEEQNRLEWENSVPLSGNTKDVFGFHLMLSVGDIANDDFIGERQKAIESLLSIYPDDHSDELFDITDELNKGIATIRKRLTRNDEVRIWYSNQPDDLCGLYWFMWELEQLTEKPKTVYIVKLPDHEYRENNIVVTHTAWGEVSPEEWHHYTSLSEKTTEVYHKQCASKWQNLQTENGLLRAVINGQLHSVSEMLYDDFIYREIDKQKDEFQEAHLIGSVMGKYQLGVGDAWLANRIEKIINDGKLFIASEPTKGMPIYHRKLRKSK